MTMIQKLVLYFVGKKVEKMGVLTWLKGKKTYIWLGIGVAGAIFGYLDEKLTFVQMADAIFICIAGMTGRAAITKSGLTEPPK